MEPATKEDVLHLEKLMDARFKTVDQKFENVATKQEVAKIAQDVAVIKSIMENEKSNRRWLVGTSIGAATVIGSISGAFIKFIP